MVREDFSREPPAAAVTRMGLNSPASLNLDAASTTAVQLLGAHDICINDLPTQARLQLSIFSTLVFITNLLWSANSVVFKLLGTQPIVKSPKIYLIHSYTQIHSLYKFLTKEPLTLFHLMSFDIFFFYFTFYLKKHWL